MRLQLKIFFIIVFCPQFLTGQFSELIRPGRPSQSIGPFTVGKGIFQSENGLNFVAENKAGQAEGAFLTVNEFRYGVLERFELNLFLEYTETTKDFGSTDIFSQEGLSSVHFGIRNNILEKQKGIIPTFGYQLFILMPFNYGVYELESPAPVMRLMTNHDIGDQLFFKTNWELQYNGLSPMPKWEIVFYFGGTLSEKFKAYVENYNFFKDGRMIGNFDTGVMFYPNSEIQIDAYIGGGQFMTRAYFYLSMGFSWRLFVTSDHIRPTKVY